MRGGGEGRGGEGRGGEGRGGEGRGGEGRGGGREGRGGEGGGGKKGEGRGGGKGGEGRGWGWGVTSDSVCGSVDGCHPHYLFEGDGVSSFQVVKMVLKTLDNTRVTLQGRMEGRQEMYRIACHMLVAEISLYTCK